MKRKLLALVLVMCAIFTLSACKKDYTLKFETNQSSISIPTIEVEEGTEIDLSLSDYILKVDGYAFKGWFSDPNLTYLIRKVTVDSNKTIYAKWVKLHTISFNSNGGSQVDSLEVEDNDMVEKPTDPTRNGYAFMGWYSDEALTTKYSFSSNVTEDITLYASWKQGLTVSFNTNGGSEIDNIACLAGDNITLPSNPTRTGYTFKGWYTDSALTEEFQALDPITKNTTLYAKWDAISYQVVFNANSGLGTMGVMNVSYDETTNLTKSVFTKTGYTFLGWATSEDGDVAYADEASITNLTTEKDAVINLYAKWSVNSYTITFHANNGTTDAKTQSCVYDETYTLNANTFTYAGHTFGGWALSASSTTAEYADGATVSNLVSEANGNIDLYAVYDVITYNVKYDKNSTTATGSMSDMAIDHTVASKNLTQNGYQNTGYTFKGWALSTTGAKAYDDEALVSGAEIATIQTNNTVTLYAVWEVTSYTVTLKSNYGSQADKVLTGNYFDGVTLSLNDFTREGYTFKGWARSSQATTPEYNDGAKIENILENITLFAVWEINTYKVTFNSNTGDGSMADLSLNYNVSGTLTKNVFTKTGYTFKGWALSTDLNKVEYADESSIVLTSNVTLYAVWEANKYTVSFNANGGFNPMSDQTFTYDYEQQLHANAFVKSYYKFMGWALSADATEVVYANGQAVKNLATSGSITLYAVWSENYYYISYNGNGSTSGSMSDEQVDLSVSKTLSSNKFSKTGYTFMGWALAADGEAQYNDKEALASHLTSTVKATVTLYAVWAKNSYSVVFNANTGSGSMSNQSFKYDEAQALSENAFTKAGYTFAGWSKTTTGSVEYADKANVSNLTEEANGTFTLYAKWTPNTYTINFNANGGEGTMEAQTFTYDDFKEISLNDFTKEYFKFLGWSRTADGNVILTNGQLLSDNLATEGEITLYAKWTENSYAITYRPNGATQASYVDEIDLASTSITIATNTFLRTGYTFNGWNTKADGTGESYAEGQVLTQHLGQSGDAVILYAQWLINQYTVKFVNEDGTVLDQQVLDYNTLPVYAGETPTKARTQQYTYTFTGWTPSIQNVSGDITYTATYSSTVNKYTVRFLNENGSLLESKEVEYGTVPQYSGATPTKESTAQYDFTFKSWNTELVAVEDNQEYTATYNSILRSYKVTWMNYDGTTLEVDPSVSYGLTPTYDAETPTKPQDVQYTYTFSGWTPEVATVTGEATYTAVFTPVLRSYQITFYDEDYTILKQYNVLYGSMPECDAPTKAADVQYTYTFAGWDSEIVAVTGAKAYTATYSSTVNKYTIKFINFDGTELQSSQVEYGETPAYTGETPIKTADAQYTYTFKGWSPAIQSVTGDKTYTAQYNNTLNKYTIRFVNYDGSLLESVVLEYGSTPAYTGETPTKPADSTNTYSFATWSPIIENVTGDATYTAVFTPSYIDYTIKFVSEGVTLSETTYHYGDTVVVPSDPTKAATAQYTYTFTGWSPAVQTVSGDQVYTAQFSSTVNKYTINFYDEDGTTLLATYEVEYGETPVYAGLTPTKATTPKYTYTFNGWNTEVVSVTGNANYSATYSSTINKYTITWVDGNGDTLKVESLEYDATPAYTGDTPTKDATAKYTYTFNNSWSPVIATVTGNETYTAQFDSTVNKYLVSFNSNGGSAVDSQNVEYDAKVVEPTAPTKSGYTFGGWYLNAELTGDAYDFDTLLTSAFTLYAKWNIVTYTITYTLNGGTNGSNPATYNVETATITLSPATKTGYTFLGWYTESEFTNQVTTIAQGSTGEVSLYAKWATINYTITYNLNNGTNGANPATFTIESADITLAPASKNGYTFEGWYSDSEFNTAVTTIAQGTHEDVELFAKYEVITYSITYNLDGGINGANPATYTVETATITLASATKLGYTFNGWYSDSEFNTEVTTIALGSTGNANLYAKFTVNTYTITYNLNGGTNGDNPATYTVDDATINFADPSKTGYDFDGWYTTSNFQADTDKASIAHGSTGNVVLYAKWSEHNYTITYNLNDGINGANPATYTINTETFTFVSASKAGYTFAGWYSESGFINQVTSIAQGSHEDKVVYAKWTPIIYTINYHLDGGTNSDVNPSSYTIESDNIYLAYAEKAGYAFQGWYSESGFINEITVIECGSIGDIDLYASYDMFYYWIYYNMPEGATNGDNPNPLTVEDADIILADATMTGYTFNGWYSESTYENKVTVIPSGTCDNVVLFAKFTINTYEITFNSNGGSSVDAQSVNHFAKVSEPADPSKTGYTFQGWYANSALTGSAYDFDTTVEGAFTLYAKWTANTYTVKFDGNGSTSGSMSDQVFIYDQVQALTANSFQKTNYAFASWNTEDDGTGDSFADGAELSTLLSTDGAEITLYAQWTNNSYTISYNANGGTGTTAPQVVDLSTQSFTASANGFTRNGYTFVGWNTREDGLGMQYSAGQTDISHLTSTIGATVTLYAKWTINTYNISYNMPEGATNGSNPATYTVETLTFDLEDATKEGYTFNGWYTEDTYQNKVESIEIGSTGDVALYAKFTINNYEITFNSNGGSTVTSQNVDHFAKVSEPTAPTKTGYTFEGWYNNAGLTGEAYDFNAIVEGTFTLYAKWNIVTYTITYTLNGGTNGSNPATYNVETATITLEDATKTGYTFVGWYTENTFQNKVTTIALGSTGDVNLYAKFTVNTYTITYNLNGGTNGDNPATYTVDDATINFADPSKTGYDFDGWYTTSNFQVDTDKASIAHGSTGNVVLYAKWSAHEYAVAYELDGGANNDNNPQFFTIEDEAITLLPATKEGYNFIGWYTDEELTQPITQIAQGTHEDLRLYAKFTIKSYTVSFNSNGGSSVDSQTVNHFAKVSQPANPSKTGYTFAGWYTEAELENEYNFNAQVTGAFTLYAKWTLVTYTITYNMPEGATNSDNNPASFNIETATITLVDASKTGYTFQGWYSDSEYTSQVSTISQGTHENVVLYAKFTINVYTIKFVDEDGTTELASYQVNYNVMPVYNAETPTKASNNTYNYSFAGWTPEVAVATADATYTATYDATYINYTIRFLDEDGTELSVVGTYHYGDTVVLPTNPTKAADNTYTYSFAGWDPEVVNVVGNATYTATYTPTYINYTVTFVDEDGETVLSTKSDYHYGDTVVLPSNPTKAATQQYTYAFNGWSPAVVAVAGNTTYTATYSSTVNKYTATFNSNGGSDVDSQTVDYGTAISAPEAPEKAGYTFGGWYINAEFTGDAYDFDTLITDSFTLYAKWNIVTYTITYGLPGGAVNSENNPTTYNVETATITLAPATKNGYTFAGWYTESGFINQVTSIALGSTGNKTFYAKFTINNYTITYNLNGGSNNANNPAQYTIESDTINLDNPTKTGYTFLGWYSDSEFNTPSSQIANGSTGNKVFYAKWEATTYTITYHMMEGASNNANNPASYTIESSDIALAAPSMTGYTFNGWYSEEGYQNVITQIESGSTGNIDLYAKFTINTYTITWRNADGSLLETDNNVEYGATPVYNGETPTKAADNTYAYTFAGWDSEITSVTGAKTYTATFTPVYINYTITFMSDGNEISSTTYHYGETVVVPSNPSKAATAQYTYTFTGWSPELQETVTGSQTYTAQYSSTVNTYTITWKNYDGTTLETDSNVEYGATPAYNGETPTRARDAQYTYTFNTWTPTVENVTGNATYTATFSSTVNNYTVSFNSNGGSVVDNQTVAYGSQAVEPENVTKTGYTISGWYTNSNLTGDAYDFDATITGDLQLYAKWTANTYTVVFNANGGTGSMPNQTLTYNEPSTLSANTYTYSLKRFVGWSTVENSSAVEFENEEEVINLASSGSITLYAIWANNYYTISFNANGGTGSMDSMNADRAATTVSLPESTFTPFDGAAFAGWSTNKDALVAEVLENLCDSLLSYADGSGVVTLYAIWDTSNVYSVEFAYYNSYESSTYSIKVENTNSTLTNIETTDYQYSAISNITNIPYLEERTIQDFSSYIYGYEFAYWYNETLNIKIRNAGSFSRLTSENGATVTLVAVYRPKSYTVVFDARYDGYTGNNGIQEVTFTFGSENNVFPSFTDVREGYTFGGWTYSGATVYRAGQVLDTRVSLVTGNETDTITLVAHWYLNGAFYITFNEGSVYNGKTPYSYTVTCNNLDGSDISVSLNNLVSNYKPADNDKDRKTIFTRPGQHIARWEMYYKTSDSVTQQNCSSYYIINSQGVFTLATSSDYYVMDTTTVSNKNYKEYYMNVSGIGFITVAALEQMTGETYPFDPTFSSCQYYKINTFYEKSDTTFAFDEPTASFDADTTYALYAVWANNEIEFSFNSNGGTGSMSNQDFVFGTEEKLSDNTFTKTGYKFSGWSLERNGDVLYTDKMLISDISQFEDGETVTLYAVWGPITYTITFNANGGTGTMDDQDIPYGSSIAISDNEFTAPAGKFFAGWHCEFNGNNYDNGQMISDLTTVDGDEIEFTAIWEDSVKVVSYNANGGTGTMSDSYLSAGSGSLKANAFTKDGYVFIGWNTLPNGNGTSYSGTVSNLESDIILYAQWQAITFTVEFNANGGLGSMSNEQFTYGTAKELTENAFARTGYTFSGWNTSADGTGTNYTDEQEVSNLTKTANGVVILYAKWTANTYTVTFNANGGTGEMATESFTYDEDAKALTTNAFSKAGGYVFIGWNTSVDGNGTSYNDGAQLSNITSNITLYAMWSNSDITITVKLTNTSNTDLGNYCNSITGLQYSNLIHGGSQTVIDFILSTLEEANAYGLHMRNGLAFQGLYLDRQANYELSSSYVFDDDTTIYIYFAPVLVMDLSDVNQENVIIDLIKASGSISSSYNGFDYLVDTVSLDGYLCIWEDKDISSIETYDVIKQYGFAKTSSSVVEASRGSNYLRLNASMQDSSVVRVVECYSGTIDMSGIIGAISTSSAQVLYNSIDSQLLSISNGVLTIDDKAFGQLIIQGTNYIYHLNVYPTLSNMAIESGYQDYQAINLAAAKYINTVKDTYKVGSANVWKIRYNIQSGDGLNISAKDVAKHYSLKVNSTDLSQEYTSYVYDGTEYNVYRYYYNSITYAYLLLDFDDVDGSYDAFLFEEPSDGQTVIIDVKPSNTLNNENIHMIVEVNAGVNVEDNWELKAAYADLNVSIINIHSKIIAELAANQYNDYYDKSLPHAPLNLHRFTAQGIAQDNIDIRFEDSGDVYSRGVKDGDTIDHLVLNGNYFTIDGSNLPILEVDKNGEALTPEQNGNVNSKFLNNSAYAGKYIKNVQTSIFVAYQDFENQVHSVYGQGDNSVTYNNLHVISNTITPVVDYSSTLSVQEQQVNTACYNSGGYNAISTLGSTIITNNVVIDYATLGINGGGEQNTLKINDTYVYYSWANSLYTMDCSIIDIKNSEFRYSGGACVHINASTATEHSTNSGAYVDESGQIIYNYSALSIDNRTRTINWIVGDEIWLQLYGMTTAQALVTGIHMILDNDGITGGQYDILKFYSQLDHGDRGDTAYTINYEDNNILFNFGMIFTDQTDDSKALDRKSYPISVVDPNNVNANNFSDYYICKDMKYVKSSEYDSNEVYYQILGKSSGISSNTKGKGAKFIANINNSLISRRQYDDGVNIKSYTSASFGNMFADALAAENAVFSAMNSTAQAKNYVNETGGGMPLYGVPVSSFSSFYDNAEMYNETTPKCFAAKVMTMLGYYSIVNGSGTNFKHNSAWADGLYNHGINYHDGTSTGYGWLEMAFSEIGMEMQVFTYYYEGQADIGV